MEAQEPPPPCISQFVIRNPGHFTPSLSIQAHDIMRALEEDLCEKYQLHGYGKEAVKGVDSVTEMLARWILVKKVKTGIKHGDQYIVVHFTTVANLK